MPAHRGFPQVSGHCSAFFRFLSAPVFHTRSAAGGIIHLTFGFACADEIVQVPPHRHLGKAGVGGDLLCGAVGACIFAQVGPDMVERLPLDALFQLRGAAFRVWAAGADHLVNVGLDIRQTPPATLTAWS